MIPVARCGKLLGLFAADFERHMPSPSPLPIADYVVGLELLGHRFYVSTDEPRPYLYIMEPEHGLPHAWREHELALMSGRKGRTEETIAFLLDRDGGPTISRHRITPSLSETEN